MLMNLTVGVELSEQFPLLLHQELSDRDCHWLNLPLASAPIVGSRQSAGGDYAKSSQLAPHQLASVEAVADRSAAGN
jgi:hypothetical protein